MVWFKVDDKFHGHQKVIRAGNGPIGLWIRCGSYCSDQTSNGFIPNEIAKAYGARSQVRKLIEVGLWTVVDGGYQMHDYLDFNPSEAEVKADRAATADRVRRWREVKRRNAVTNGDVTALQPDDVTPLVTLPRPVPVREEGCTESLTRHGSLREPASNGRRAVNEEIRSDPVAYLARQWPKMPEEA